MTSGIIEEENKVPRQQKRALIFGISGQDGAYLAKLLLSKGYEVHGTSRDAEVSNFNKLKILGVREQVKLYSTVLTDFRSTLQVIAQVEPDEIYNLAGQSSVGLSFQQPVETLDSIAIASLNILESLRFLGAKTRFYNAGSSECFGDNEGKPADEATAFRPRSPYAVAKATAFWQVTNYRESYGLFACSGILFNHESPLRPSRFVTKKIIEKAVQISNGSQEILKLGDLSIKRDWGWAPEYVEAMWRMLQQPKPDDFVIATGEANSLKDFLKITFEKLELDWNQYVRFDEELLRPSELKVIFGDPSKAMKELGWQAKLQLPELIEQMIRAEQQKISVN